MTGFGGCRGVWVKKSLAQPPVSSAADRESSARKLRGMGLGPALRAVAGAAAARQVDRHANAEMRSGVLPVHDLHRAAVGGDELQYDGEADSGALDGRALGGPAGVEGLEHVVPILLGNAGAVVRDVHDEGAGGSGGFDVNGASLRGVFDGIRHQVLEYQANFAAVGDERHIFHLDVEAHTL